MKHKRAKPKARAEAPNPYNPLDKEKLGESVANALLNSPIHELPPSNPFVGAGVYAIYYSGDFPPYEVIRGPREGEENWRPIYVGKAVPEGARKGHLTLDSNTGDSLYQRLREHGSSVDQVGLGRANFRCRYLVVDDIWIPLGESLLIREFRPVWNVLLEGFGNHDPGKRRKESLTSRWDTVHTGRRWVEKRKLLPNPKSSEEWIAEVSSYLATGNSPNLLMDNEIGYSAENDEE